MASQYEAMDGTDKVLFAHYLGQAEYHLELATIQNPLLRDLKEVGPTEIQALSTVTQWYNNLATEIRYFSIPDLVSVTTKALDVDSETQEHQQITLNKNQKKRVRKKTQTTTSGTATTTIHKQETPQKTTSKAPDNRNTSKTASRNNRPDYHTATQSNTHHVTNEESVGEWWLRTEDTPSAREIAQRQIREYEARLARKAKAKVAKNHSEKKLETAPQDLPSSERENTPPEETVKLSLKNHFTVFEQIMNETYNGEIAPVLNMIQNGLEGHTVQGSGSRVRLRLRNFDTRQLESQQLLLAEMTNEVNADEPLTNESNLSQETTNTVMHTPHKRKSKRLRPEHVKTIKHFLEKANYTLDTVGK